MGGKQQIITGRTYSDKVIETIVYALSKVKRQQLVFDFTCLETCINGTSTFLIYYVGVSNLSESILADRFEKEAGEQLKESNILFCSVSNIPYDSKGNLDVDKLINLSVINTQDISRWQQSLSTFNSEDSTIIISENYEQQKRFHVDEWPISLCLNNVDSAAYAESKAVGNVTKKELLKKNTENKKQSISSGGELSLNAGAPKNMVDAIIKTAEKFPSKGIYYIDSNGEYYFQTYPELLLEAKTVLGALQKEGLQTGDYTVLQFTDQRLHLISFWACLLGGIIPVTVEYAGHNKDALKTKLTNTINLLVKANIITQQALIEDIGELDVVEAHAIPLFAIEYLQEYPQQGQIVNIDSGNVIFHQLTSGSTGNSKCVQITHRGVIAHINAIAQFNNYSSDDIGLNWLPLDHVAPILMMHFKDLYLGIQHILVQTNRILSEPLSWLDYMEQFQVTHTWAPNFGFKLVVEALKQDSSQHWELSHVKEMLNAGEQVTKGVIEEFLRATRPFGVGEYVMQPCYGSAETCTAITYRNDFSLDKEYCIHQVTSSEDVSKEYIFVDLGRPIPGVEICVVNDSGEILPEENAGHLLVRGDVVTPGYLNNPGANSESFTIDGWYRTGDLAFIKDAALVITGRAKEMIIIKGENYYCYDLEDSLEQISGVKTTFVGVCGVDVYGTGTDELVVFFVPEFDQNEDALLINALQEIRKKLSINFGLSTSHIIPINVNEFPKTTSGKIQRDKLKKNFEAGEFIVSQRRIDLLIANDHTLPQWFFTENWARKDLDARFNIGGGRVLIFVESQEQASILGMPGNLGNWSTIVYFGKTFARNTDGSFSLRYDCEDDYQKLLTEFNVSDPVSGIIYFSAHLASKKESIQLNEKNIRVLQNLAEISKNFYYRIPCIYLSYAKLNHFGMYSADICLGLLCSISQECSNLELRFVGLEQGYTDLPKLLKDELFSSNDKEIIYSAGERWVKRLQSITNSAFHSMPIEKEGHYILTGGLGGIGFSLAKKLLKNFRLTLTILGQSKIDDDRVSQALTKLRHFGRVEYQAVDLSRRNQIDLFFDALDEPVEGVLHLAGSYEGKNFIDHDLNSLNDSMAVKTDATIALAEHLQKINPKGLFVTFSSVYAYFGGAAMSSYCAANQFLQSYSVFLRNHTELKSHCLAWSNWDDIGMSKGYRNVAARGYQAISFSQGYRSMLLALSVDSPVVYIGLDAGKNNISNHILQTPKPRSRVIIKTESNLLPENHERLRIESEIGAMDFMGRPLKFEWEIKEALEILCSQRENQSKSQRVIRRIWQDVLLTDRINMNDNFFEVGGSSVVVPRLVKAISEELNKPFSMIDFFKYPTVEQMATYIDNVDTDSVADQKIVSSSRISKRKQLQQRRRRKANASL